MCSSPLFFPLTLFNHGKSFHPEQIPLATSFTCDCTHHYAPGKSEAKIPPSQFGNFMAPLLSNGSWGGGGRQKWLSTFTTTRGAFVARATLNCSCGVSLKSVLDFYTVTTPTQVRSLGMKSAQSGCRQVCSFPSFFFCFPHLSLLFSANLCPRHSSHDSFFRLKIRLLSFAQSSLSLPL